MKKTILFLFIIFFVCLIACKTSNYIVTYNGNDNDSGNVPVDSNVYKEGETVTVLDNTGNLTKIGYTFSYWNTINNGTGDDYYADDTFLMPTNDVILYAKWIANQYTVAFDSQGGSAVSPQIINYGGLVNEPTPPPTKITYTFGGWFIESDCINEWNFATDTMPANDITLYAKWTINQYTVTFDSQGGSAVSPQIINYGGLVTEPTPPPKRIPYTFSGWFTESECTNEWNFATDTMPDYDITLYAKWVIISVTIDSGDGDIGSWASMTIDSDDKIHISYSDVTNFDLKYATNAPSGTWQYETLDSTNDTGRWTSIAVDSNNKVHISYQDNTNKDLKYATNTSGDWVYIPLDSTDNVGVYTSIAIDSDDYVHISYYDDTNDDLKYATNAPSGTWQCETLDSADNVGEWTSIAIDSNDHIYISYYDNTNGNLKYAYYNGTGWEYNIVDDGGSNNVGRYTSIAIDNTDKIHISYYDDTNDDLKYATNSSGTWVCIPLDSIDNVGRYTSIAIDNTGKLHISYSDVTNTNLKYATNVSGTWQYYTLDDGYDTGYFTSIALGSNNKVHIVYYDFAYTDLKYITW